MKYIYFACLIVSLTFIKCSTTQKDIRHLVQYMYKDKPVKDKNEMHEFETKLISGYTLYKTNCSECHGHSAIGKDHIPVFSFKQLDSYGAAALKGDPKNHAIAKKLSPDQLQLILTFLFFNGFSDQLKLHQAEPK